MIRLFVAIELPVELKERLFAMGGGVPGAKWVRPENLHLTLRFIGEVGEGRLGDIDAALPAVRSPAFDLTLADTGHFSSRRASRVLWVGVEKTETLSRLQARVEAACVGAGLEPEGRNYSAHITLARLNRAPSTKVSTFLAANAMFKAPAFRVTDFILFSSFLARNGAIHRQEATYALDGS